MANEKVRLMARKNGVRHWEIAIHIGVSEQTLVRWLRTPLNAERESIVCKAIEDLAAEKAVKA